MADETDCIYVVDTSELRDLAQSKSNSVKAFCFDLLSKGKMVVPVCVWKEFRNLFEDDAQKLEKYIRNKVRSNRRYHIGAAAIADKCNPGFPLSPYDGKSDWYAASISISEGWTLVTSGRQLDMYGKLGCSSVVSVDSLHN